MIVIVGLGNPGEEYARTRHNVGFMAVDEMAKQLGAPSFSFKPKLHAEVTRRGDVFLVKPQTFMNKSGEAVRAVLEYFTDWQPKTAVPWLYVVHDDLDITVGNSKLQLGTGPKQHNGLLSIYDCLGTKEFWHARIGVDGRNGDHSIPPDKYVLQTPSPQDTELINQSIHKVVQQLRAVL